MCGIVGHLGPNGSLEVVLEGLKRLEYRGYDSAGVSFLDDQGSLNQYKKEGKIENLLESIGDKKYQSHLCIGHTRWATHGKVNDTNAHPHTFGDVSIIHNGIIENDTELKSEMASNGFEFKTETDSEVFLALLVHYLKTESNLILAVGKAFKRIEGNSAFVVLHGTKKEIVAVKRAAPLVCGAQESGVVGLVSSDPYALAGHVSKLFFPEDEVICSLSSGNTKLLNFYELDGKESDRFQSQRQKLSKDSSDKGNFEHYMLKEIYEQPGLIKGLAQYYLQGDGMKYLNKAGGLEPKNVYISACGTASYAGLVIRDYLESINKIPTQMELASEFRYREPLITEDDLCIVVSQSGETADTLAALQMAKGRNVPTLGIVNVEGSTIYRDCLYNLLIRGGVEVGVASTKAFTLMCLTGRLLSLCIEKNLSDTKICQKLFKKFELLAIRLEELLANVEHIKDIAFQIYNYKGFFFTGRGAYYPVALEGALKLKEIAYVHAEGYAAGELKHGPIALIDENTVNIAVVGETLVEKTLSNIQEIRARRGIIVGIGPKENKKLEDLSDHFIPLNFEGLEELGPLYVNVANQLLAYYVAKNKGTDIDKPRNLAKSVTVE